jgi:integrase
MLELAWKRKLSQLRPKTQSTYFTKLVHFSRWYFNKGNPKLTPILAREYIEYVSVCVKSSTTVNSYLRTLKTLCTELVAMDYFDKNPFIGIKKIPENRISQKYFRSNEIAILKQLLQTNPMQWMATQLLFYCFIRPGEIRELLVSDVDIDLGVIHIRGAISKNKKAQSVIIPNQFINAVQEWIEGIPQHYYFINQSAMPLSRDAISKQHRQLLEHAGYGKGYSFYSWKHTGAIHAAKNGINLKDLQMQLRHHSLDMVNEYLKQLGVIDSVALRENFPTL